MNRPPSSSVELSLTHNRVSVRVVLHYSRLSEYAHELASLLRQTADRVETRQLSLVDDEWNARARETAKARAWARARTKSSPLACK